MTKRSSSLWEVDLQGSHGGALGRQCWVPDLSSRSLAHTLSHALWMLTKRIWPNSSPLRDDMQSTIYSTFWREESVVLQEYTIAKAQWQGLEINITQSLMAASSLRSNRALWIQAPWLRLKHFTCFSYTHMPQGTQITEECRFFSTYSTLI